MRIVPPFFRILNKRRDDDMKMVFRSGLSKKQDGSADGSGWFRELEFAFRPRLPMVPGWFRDGSVRFA